MADPLFWLALSFLLVVISLTAVLMVAIPAMRELGRAARSAEKFFDTLGRELPPTLEAIRLTGLEIVELTDDVTEGVQSAGQVVQQVNQSISTAQTGAKRLNTGTKTFMAGARAAWQAWTKDPSPQPPPRRPAKLAQTPQPVIQPGDRAPIPTPDRRPPELEDSLIEDGRQEHQSDGGASPEGNRPLPGVDAPLPQLEETTLHALPETGLETAPAVDSPELLPSRSPQQTQRRPSAE
ncbi:MULTISPECIES: DUF948 domain-containing protein [Cyanophyceae]|uniref:DUF948 domain-containing protein n=1 Tax=Cyanophyceae TaxID=3028117 RepID=UPI001686B231|nr:MULTISPECIES: DUF948 domain-containing protein [Cyanophyceae]MBD1914546.1 DUF948 domain-containing protein [Phormidium sp. FACHB-77]MBD2033045.1 DUF948 domain-containing protein [Phormidium sp. FACHB-322]MBD2049816.1 DUF948 domain-containing protein [Leptolyngbya sp. FACHB-60]